MTDCAELFVKRNVVRFALTGLVGIWLSGCSADTSRFADGGNPFANGNPFGNPFSTASNAAAAPTPRVASTPLASANPNYVASAHPNPVAVSSLPAPTAPATTGQIRSASQPVQGSAVGWTAVGGSPVIVAENDSLNGLSERYGVPVAALMSANGLSSASQIHGGMRIVVPVYNSRGRTEATPVAAARERRPEVAEAEPAPSKAKVAKKAEREAADASDDAARSKVKKKAEREAADASDDAARSKAKKKAEREAADASADAAKSKAKKNVEHEAADASADAAKSKAKKKVEHEAADASDDAAKSKAKKKVEHEAADASDDAAKSKAKGKVAETVKTPGPSVTVAKLDPAKTAPKRVDPTPTGNVRGAGTPAAPPLTGAQADASGVAPEFRWPARGRIIQGFKSGGNDGINISVPEGTSVRAAENGTVAYAGNELKGYGNLVLIRHPNGFVTAYANNGELNVKRGDVVKRGQVIAKSGESGNVSSPQLHFELRKGSTPVDPTSYLAGL
jgi:murein DD-endopeptidase MepM/ murein hydrolase activator NlpD